MASSSAVDVDQTERDSRCDPEWPLANLWPVYVRNFHCKKAGERDNAIRQFFASKELTVRCWFSRSDDHLHKFQIKEGLYDMLVYFTSREKAEQAIASCHHQLYNEYTLSVFPGREPVYFPADKTIYYSEMGSQGHTFSEYFLGNKVQLGVDTVVQFHVNRGAVEFATVDALESAMTNDRFGRPQRIQPNSVKKQRYIERDVKEQIAANLKQFPARFPPGILKSVKTGTSNAAGYTERDAEDQIAAKLKQFPEKVISQSEAQKTDKKDKADSKTTVAKKKRSRRNAGQDWWSMRRYGRTKRKIAKTVEKAFAEGKEPSIHGKNWWQKERYRKAIKNYHAQMEQYNIFG